MSTSKRRWWGVVCVLVGAASLFCSACAPKSPDLAVWNDQARHALGDVRSDVDTLELVLLQQRSDKLPQNYQQVVAIDSEESIGTTADSFSSVQPPVGVDERYKKVTSLLSAASDLAAATRIAIVREDVPEYPRLLQELKKMSEDLAKADRYRRLRVSEPNRDVPWRIDFAEVDRLDSAIHFRVPREGLLRRDKVEHRLGDLTGMNVLVTSPSNREPLGTVLDARFSPGPNGRLVLESLIVGQGRPGSLLGYDRRRTQGPWLVGKVVRRLHRHTVLADAADAAIDWEQREVRLDRRPTDPPGRPFE